MNISDEMKKLLIEPDKVRLDSVPTGFFNRVQDFIEEKNEIINDLVTAVEFALHDVIKSAEGHTLNKNTVTQLRAAIAKAQGELSNDAKITATVFFMMPGFTSLSFNRSHIITPRMRASLDELVEAGYLTMHKLNDLVDSPIEWKSIEGMGGLTKVSQEFIKKHQFDITSE